VEVFRLCLKQQPLLDGEGARLYGGRWNSAGRAVIYTSRQLSLAVLEYLVHVEPDNLPDNLIWLRIHVPDNAPMEKFTGETAPPEFEACLFGNKWIERGKTLALIVPSAILSTERNVLINPRHASMSRIKVLEQQPFSFDKRFFKH
jgi:RES domain-containing protein